MKTPVIIAALAFAAGALSGCVRSDIATPAVDSAQMQPSPAGPPFVTTMDGAVTTAEISSCQNALAALTTGGVTVVGSEFSAAASAVYMRVGANGAPWQCLVSSGGGDPSLMFVGDEGAL